MTKKQVIFDKKNILVIGGAGFIGSNLIEHLLQNNKVICIDSFVTGNYENIHSVLQFPDFELIKHDMSEKIDLEKIEELKKFRIEFQGIQDIIYLACPTSYKDSDKYSIETIDANSIALKNSLELAKKYESRFLFTSTSAVYGDAEDVDGLVDESYIGKINHLESRAPYNEGKKFAEMMVYNYHKKYNLDISIVRIFYTYGPKMITNDGRLIPDFINCAFENKDLVIYGSENKTSTFCYIEDVIDALLKDMDTPFFEPLNIGNPEEIEIKKVAEKIIELIGSKSKIVFENDLDNIQRRLIPDITKAKELFGWMPMTRLEDGLRKTIDHIQRERTMLTPNKLNL
ncbi:MAG: GDP-mannose 4,6-dehydratase [Patescibacteria group bacterium]|nr:GDP-mannose 4,6-dehydratase [Patescibacteria group bacterium]MDD4304323.1 GDP-mannose 4,6-dehydratase [Patescibacteria group bacterium]MDD4695586.1 GDP-mannose 4,6-dehydratase [Patescibacteria group bacterium]